jgi:hypothetical protein
VRGAQGSFKVFAGTATGKQKAAAQQLSPRIEIKIMTLALDIGSMRATFVRTLVPANPKPAQIFEGGISVV